MEHSAPQHGNSAQHGSATQHASSAQHGGASQQCAARATAPPSLTCERRETPLKVRVGAEAGWLALASDRQAVMGDSWWLAKAFSFTNLTMSPQAAGQPPDALRIALFGVQNVDPMADGRETPRGVCA